MIRPIADQLGHARTWLVDPGGYRIELVEWPPGHSYGITAADFAGQDGA